MSKSRTKEDYPYILSYRTRWSDNDQYGHMNNSIYYHYFDSIVNDYLIKHCGLTGNLQTTPIIGLVISSFCEFFAPIAFPEIITLGLRVTKLGRSSVSYEVGVFKEDVNSPATVGGYTHVFVDSESRKSVGISTQARLEDGLRKLVTGSVPLLAGKL